MRAALLALVSCTSVAFAQVCTRPTPPVGGHPTTTDLLVPVAYSDGYQTFGSLIRPAGPPPSCGWPLVVHVHPLGQSRGFDLPLQMLLAGQGYAVWSFDVRGQGQAIAANVGHANAGCTFWGPHERCDLAEQVQFVAANAAWTGIVDATRVAVVGSSQGGAHAWLAAAWSGQAVMVAGRTPTVFPTIACVAATDFSGEALHDWVRDGRLWSDWFVEAMAGSYQGMPFDAAFVQACRAAFEAQDVAPLATLFAAEDRLLGPRLATSTVPVLFGHAYFDQINGPLQAVARLEAMTAPRRALLGTIGHGTPHNVAERDLREATIARWLHRWLWLEANEVEFEGRFVLPEVPLRQSDRDDPAFLWSRGLHADVTTPAAASSFWLHDDSTLQVSPPVAPQTDAIVQQTIDPLATTFTPVEYLAQPAVRALANVLAVCPLQERVYTTTLAAEAQLAASATWHARVLPHDAAWMLAALLTVQPADPGAAEVMLASGAISSTTSVPGIAETHTLRLPPVAARLPAGATLRLRVRNLWLREAPMDVRLEVAPRFHDFRVDLVHGDVTGSRLALPLEPVQPRLVADRTWLDLAAPLAVAGTIRGGVARGGYPYFATVGLSGQVPGTIYLNGDVPIEADWLVLRSVGSSEQPFFTSFLGFLDNAGDASVALDFSSLVLPQELNGYRLTLCAFVWDGPWAPTGAPSNAADVELR